MRYSRPPGQPDFIAVLVYDFVSRKRIRYDSLAAMCGISCQSLSNWMGGKSTINSWDVARVLLVLGFTVRQSVNAGTVAESFRRAGFRFAHWSDGPIKFRTNKRKKMIDDAVFRARGVSPPENFGDGPSS